MRISVGSKIFGIAGSMLVMMLAVSLVTLWKTREVRSELENIADRLVPITNRVASMGTAALKQKLLVAQMFARLNYPEDPGPQVATLRAAFEAQEVQVDLHLLEAVRLAAAGVHSAPDEDDRIDFARIELNLGAIDRQHQEYYELALRVVGLREADRLEAAAALSPLLEKEQDDFDRAVERATLGLQALSERASTEAEIHSEVLTQYILGVTLLGMILGLIYAAGLTKSLTRPLHELLRGTKEVEAGHLDTVMQVTSRDEIGELSGSFNRMVEGLRVKERIKDIFGKYVDPRVVEGLIGDGGSIATDGEKRPITVFFSDIAGFTPIGERLTAKGLVKLINGYLTLASQPIIERSGIIDKYIGDAVMAFWGPPFVPDGSQARLGCLAALDSFAMLERFREQLPELMGLRSGLPEIHIRIGLASGDAVVGDIGSDVSKSYTVMGDTVNLGSRLEGVNKVYGTRILTCERTREQCGDAAEFREIDTIAVVGKHEGVRIYELLCRAGELAPEMVEGRRAYERGLAAYRERAWDAARLSFEQCLEACPGDPPAVVFLKRLEQLRLSPPADAWDGVWRMASK